MTVGWDVILRLSIAFALGALVGYEREIHKKPAGLRTHVLISLASALFTLISMSVAFGNGSADPTRIASQVLTGMGFVGAGVIIFAQGKLHGVTTAASLWITAAIGMAAGLGEYLLAGFSALLTLISLTVLWRVEDRLT